MPKDLPSTQLHIPIEDIVDGIVVLKNGGAALIIETTAVNFELLSEPEQDAMIAAFGHLLNSLSFHIQLVIRSKKLDISSYIESLRQSENSQKNPLLKKQIASYRAYITELISKNEVLDKDFYIVIPFTRIALTSLVGNPISGIKKVLRGKVTEDKKREFDKQKVVEQARMELEPKKAHILKQLGRLGLKGHVLDHEELIELFYDIYNPEVARKQKLQNEGTDYQAYLVQPAVKE